MNSQNLISSANRKEVLYHPLSTQDDQQVSGCWQHVSGCWQHVSRCWQRCVDFSLRKFTFRRTTSSGRPCNTKDFVARKYEEMYRWHPSNIFMIAVVLLQIIIFIYNVVMSGRMEIPLSYLAHSILVHKAEKMIQMWRIFTYAFLHESWSHVICNSLWQIIFGLPLEMVHGSGRVALIYLLGIASSSVSTWVFGSRAVYLIGASGGVYALFVAHLVNVFINFKIMKSGIFRLIFIFFFALINLVFNLQTVVPWTQLSNSFSAHIGGISAGLIVSKLVLKDLGQEQEEEDLIICRNFKTTKSHNPLDVV